MKKRGKLLNRETLLTKEDLKVEKVEFDDGTFVCVRQMTARERDRYERTLMKAIRDPKKGNKTVDYETNIEDFRAKLAVHTICDEKGELILKSGDYEKLSESISAAKIEKIINKAQELNAISEEDKEALTKNLGATQHEDSSSD